MGTTVTLDPDTEQIIRRWMRERGMTSNEAPNDAIRNAAAQPVPFRTETASMGEPSVNLDRALQIVGELEDDDVIRRT